MRTYLKAIGTALSCQMATSKCIIRGQLVAHAVRDAIMQNEAPLTFFAPNPRARAPGASPTQRVGQQSDPLAPRAALRGCWPLSQLLFSGFSF